ncbi:MAG: hypothetical protein H6735_02350 [Alphaproteobacteria bacterium]|nr:hypothetical protein [Alphaproteobacteria bacterium]
MIPFLWLIAASPGWESLPGRWYPADYRPASLVGLGAPQRELVSQLEALGYVGASEPGLPGSGVVAWDASRTADGVNLYSSGHASEALLVGMDGRELHRWSADFHDVFPQHPSTDPKATGAWRRVALRRADGHLLAVWEGLGLVHLDAGSRVVWATANRAHHDVRWLPDGGALVLTRVLHPGGGVDGAPLFEDFVAQLDADGHEVRRVSVLAALAASPWAGLLQRSAPEGGDPLHTNALAPITSPVRPTEVFRPGRVVLSFRHLDAIGVLDLDEGRLVWAATGDFDHQHDAELTPSGALQLFDNRGGPDHASRVLVLDPTTMEPRWTWAGQPGLPLRSDVLGAVQELPNGNRLVTESTRGRAVEVTPDGDVVWEYHNPRSAGPDGDWVAAIFEIERIGERLPWLPAAAPGR